MLPTKYYHLVFFPALIGSLNAFSQDDRLLFPAETGNENHSVFVNSSLGVNSTTLTNAFYKTVLNSDYLDDNMKNSISSRLMKSNRIGGDFVNGTGYTGTLCCKANCISSTSYFFFDLSDCQHFDTKFSDDAMNLTLFGNNMFAGKAVHLGNFNLNLLRYQQARLGLVIKDTTGSAFGAALSYLKGEEFLSVSSRNMDFYTGSIGDYLSLKGDLEVHQSDTGKTGLGALNGHGFSADLFFGWRYWMFVTSKRRPGTIRFELSDNGMFRWNKNSVSYNKDTSYYYEGIVIDSIGEFKTVSSQVAAMRDSVLESINSGWNKGVFTSRLPARVQLSVKQQIRDKMIVEAGLVYRLYSNYNLFGYYKEKFLLTDFFSIGWMIGYGGYGKWGIGADASFRWKMVSAEIGIRNMEGFIFKEKFGGMGGFVSLRGGW